MFIVRLFGLLFIFFLPVLLILIVVGGDGGVNKFHSEGGGRGGLCV